jgi:hypothetical protein
VFEKVHGYDLKWYYRNGLRTCNKRPLLRHCTVVALLRRWLRLLVTVQGSCGEGWVSAASEDGGCRGRTWWVSRLRSPLPFPTLQHPLLWHVSEPSDTSWRVSARHDVAGGGGDAANAQASWRVSSIVVGGGWG